jgi:TolB-like protein/tetratricopeptide (TPR) repeat protein
MTPVAAQLDRILASPEFATANRLSRFLRFIVEKASTGQAAAIKEYTIAIEVYDRDASCDPHLDSIVPVEASRLRTKLKKYYENPSRAREFIISLPTGSYVPVFDSAVPQTPEVPGAERPRRSPRLLAALAVVLVIAASATVAWRHWNREPAPASLAVLPFTDLSADPANQRFANELTEDVTASLAKIPGLAVTGRTAAYEFQGRSLDPKTMGTRLNVRYLLEGSERVVQQESRVTAQLIKVENGYHLWSQTYERGEATDLQVQSRLARLIAETAASEMIRNQNVKFAAVEPGAIGSHLQGTQATRLGTHEGFQQSIALHEKAGAQDRSSARAHAALANSILEEARDQSPARLSDVEPARTEAGKAVQFQPDETIGHQALGWELLFQWDFPGAERELRKALPIDLGDFVAPQACADCETILGNFDAATTFSRLEVTRGRRFRSKIAQVCFRTHRFDQAMEQARVALEYDPKDSVALLVKGAVLERQGHNEEAIHAMEAAARLKPSARVYGSLGHVYGQTGRVGDARRILAKLSQEQETHPAFYEAMVWPVFGDSQRALEQLRESKHRRELAFVYAAVEPRFDSLRSDPRFAESTRSPQRSSE